MKQERKKIVLITIFVHLFYFLLFPFAPRVPENKTFNKPMKVVTKVITPPRAKAVHLDNSDNQTKPLTAKHEVASFLPKASPPKRNPSKKVPVQKAPVKKAKAVRGKLDKNVAKIKAKKPPTTKKISVKKEVSKTPSLSMSTSEKGIDEKHEYLKKISHSLQEWLTLPEKGNVKVTITVQANGKIVNMEVLTKDSEKNWEYLKTVLPGIQLPKFEENKEITFTITFCDD